MDRILITGCSAAGKSTLTRRLGGILGIDVFHLDKLLWKSGCRLSEPDDEMAIVKDLLRKTRWIIDGNYPASLPERLQAADTVVLVDFGRMSCIAGALKRLLHYRGRTRPDMGANCPERIDIGFMKWIWDYPNRERPELMKLIDKHARHARLIVLQNRTEMDKFLAEASGTIRPSLLLA